MPDADSSFVSRSPAQSFGVPQNLVQDAAGDRLPTTRGY